MHVNDLLKIAVESGASDLHLKVGSYPMMRVRGHADARPPRTSGSSTRTWWRSPPPSCRPASARNSRSNHEVDLAYSVAGPRPVPLQRVPAARHDRDDLPRHPDAASRPSTSWRCRRS